jgi:hypothetical protein
MDKVVKVDDCSQRVGIIMTVVQSVEMGRWTKS